MRTGLISFILMVLCCHTVFAQRGVGVMKTNADGSKREVRLYDGSYALVIGNSDYSMGWNRLGGVKGDVVAVRDVLERHGFKVEVEENLTSERFEQRIRKFIDDYGFDRDNRLVIYYAGHGHTLKSVGDTRDLGYIIPADTPLPDKDPRGFRQKAVSMYTIQTFAKEIQAKHAFFVFDSCFSGKLFVSRSAPKLTPFIVEKIDYPVRQFITAGDENQTVPDESIFRKAFVRGLEGDADRNNDGYIVGTELAEYLKEAVINYSNRRQTPQFGTINDIDLDRGDFVFVKLALDPIPAPVSRPALPIIEKAAIQPGPGPKPVSKSDNGKAAIQVGPGPGPLSTSGSEAALHPFPSPKFSASGPEHLSNSAEDQTSEIPFIKTAEFKGTAKNFLRFNQIGKEPKDGLTSAVSNNKWFLVNDKGAVAFTVNLKRNYTIAWQAFSEGFSRVFDGNRAGFIDKEGNEVVPLKYNSVESFSDGLAKVCVYESSREIYPEKCGFIDTKGNEVIPLDHKYYNAKPFSEGLAAVRDGYSNGWGFIDKSGRDVVSREYANVERFSEGLALVNKETGAASFGKFGFINRTGQVVIPIKYDGGARFSEGLAPVKLNGKWGFIDKSGAEVVPVNLEYDLVREMSEGMAVVRKKVSMANGYQTYMYGVIDKNGKQVVPPKYDQIGNFKNGLAEVTLNSKIGFIDKQGLEVIPARYSDTDIWCTSHRDKGIFGVTKNGKKGFIDIYGNEYFDL